jgi:hypothetical protein
MPCALGILPGNTLIGFAPLKHVDIEELRMDLSCLTHQERLSRFVYLLSVHHSSTSQVLFHTCSARGVPLTEPFAGIEAVTFADPLLPCGSFPNL